MTANIRRTKAFALTCFFTCTLGGSSGFAKGTEQATPSHSLDEWDVATSTFHKSYADERRRVLAALGPVLIVGQGKLVLCNGPIRKEESDEDSVHDQLKIIDHEVLTLFLLLRSKCDRRLDEVTLKKLSDLKNIFAKTDSIVHSLQVSDPIKSRQRALLQVSIDFVDIVLKNKIVSAESLRAFTRSAGRQTLENASYAIAARLDHLEKRTHSIVGQLSTKDRARLHVIIFGPHMARAENAEMQFFQKMLGETEEGHRIIYFEGAGDEEAALNLLATHSLDADIGSAFFGDASFMHRDLLSKGARSYLEKHPPKPLSP
jgi:hypothetical protein